MQTVILLEEIPSHHQQLLQTTPMQLGQLHLFHLSLKNIPYSILKVVEVLHFYFILDSKEQMWMS